MRTRMTKLIELGVVLVAIALLLANSTVQAKTPTPATDQLIQNAPAHPQPPPIEVGLQPAVPAAASVVFNLCASDGSITLPDSSTVNVWGFVDTDGAPCTTGLVDSLPGPELRASHGDSVTINLTNALAENVSIMIPGQSLAATGGTSGLFAAEAAASGGSVSYSFTAQEGSYLYESGTNAGIQVAMGLYGALIVNSTTPGQAYGNAFDQEAVLLLSEIDPALNANPEGFKLLNYHPTYWLINGAGYPDIASIVANPGDRILLRYLNAGFDYPSMTLLGAYQEVIAKEGFELNHSFDAVAEIIPAGTTADMIVNTNGLNGSLPLYNRNMYLTNGDAYPGGMLTFIEVGTVTATYGVTVNPASDAQSGAQDSVVSYNLNVTNDSNVADTFNVTVGGNTWATSTPPPVGPLAAGETVQITVDVTIPAGAIDGESDTATVTVTSQASVSTFASSSLTTTAITPIYDVSVAPASGAQSSAPGDVVAYSLDVTNNGNVVDTFDVSVGGNIWTTSAPTPVGPLTPGETAQINVVVTIPAEAANGSSDTATVTATSQASASTFASSNLTTTAVTPVYAVSVAPTTDAQSGVPDDVVAYNLDVTNDGNMTETFDVTVSGNAWDTSAPLTVGPLAPGETAQITVDVTVSSGANNGDSDTATVTVTSQVDTNQSASSDLTTTASVAAVYGVSVAPTIDAQSGAPNDVVAYNLDVTNDGNVAETFDVTVSGNTWDTSAPLTVGPLAPGETAQINVEVTIPGGASENDSDTATVTVTSQVDTNQSASSDLTTTATAAVVYGVSIAPATDSQTNTPGTVVSYNLDVTNDGNGSDTFNVSVDGNGWTTSAPATVGSLAAGETAQITVDVTIPAGANDGDSNVTTVTVTSQDNTTSASSNLTTHVVNTIHVGDLDDTSTPPANGPNWNARVVVTVHDVGHNPVNGATVTVNAIRVRKSNGSQATSTLTCSTNASGQCSVTQAVNSNQFENDVTFNVISVSSPTPYDSGDNHDPDGGSDGITIVVANPG
ncbi:MAG: multicopper oxidase domain-containing protein [Anaerolineae bacterium]|nr:multicopper oxidase domain-containing protein [Anaerolineae bacterium]